MTAPKRTGGGGGRSTDNGPDLGPRWEVTGGVMCVGGVPRCGVGGALLPSRLLRGCGEEVEGELRPESLGRGVGALALAYPRLGWPGCPGTPWGRRLPTSAGCKTSACVSVTEVLRVRYQELTHRGELWAAQGGGGRSTDNGPDLGPMWEVTGGVMCVRGVP